MKRFVTTLYAIDQTDGIIKNFVGQTILANDYKEAEEICKQSFPYLSVMGEFVSEVDCDTLKELNEQLN